VAEHDDWSPLDEAESAVQIESLIDLCAQRGWTRVMDLGCGSGRVALPLAEAGVRVLAIDEDERALAALRNDAQALGVTALIECAKADFFADDSPMGFSTGERAQAAILLGNTLLEIHEVDRAVGLFARVRSALDAGGGLIIDRFVGDIWADVAEGAWQEGVSEDGDWQMVWTVGDEVVALRRGDDVDPDDWEVRDDDRRFRLWSMGSLRLLALSSGWGGPEVDRSGALLVFGTT
jgi:SAM-dependent methyltransferase